MINFSIALSGLRVAQQAIEMIGTNISNAATEGYHRQDLTISPVANNLVGLVPLGGAEVTAVRRSMDATVEQEMVRQQTLQGAWTQQSSALKTIESILGTLDSSGLNQALGGFYQAIRELAGQADSGPLREQVVQSADTLAGQFRTVSGFLANLEDHLTFEAGEQVRKINDLTSQIAALNRDIADASNRGGSPNLLLDRRDQAIQELAGLADIAVEGRNDPSGQVSIVAWGIAVVTHTYSTNLEASLVDDQKLGIGVEGSGFFQDHFRGGSLGEVLALKNEALPGIRGGLDTLARQVMTSFNQQHAQGVGQDGPFTELTGVPKDDGAIAGWGDGVTAGDFYVRVTDASDGSVTRSRIHVTPAADTLATVAARIDALTGLSATVNDGTLSVRADHGFTFDFLPAPDAEPTTQSITGTARAAVSGAYTGAANQGFSFRAVGGGEVGVSSGLHLEVRAGDGNLVKTLNVGLGYAAGDPLDAGDGLWVSLTRGTLNAGDAFTVEALSNADTSGFLAAAGLNTFFSGSSAMDMMVRPEYLSQSRRLACSQTPGGMDNGNIARLSALADAPRGALGHQTPVEFFSRFLTGVGQSVSTTGAKLENAQDVMQQLNIQRDRISGVDVNQEAAKLLVFERMYQGLAKFLDTENQSLKYLMDMT